MPAPMKPAPNTPIRLIVEAPTDAGRRVSLLSACMETKSVRAIAAASFVCRICVK
ncbi:hypothetical protein D3C83_331790 [compost metagenome]